jgi:hypothetical protein
MEVAAFFLLVLIVIVVALAGVAVYAIAARLRQQQLGRHGDRVEGPEGVEEAHRRAGHDPRPERRRAPEGRSRPEHVKVDTEQRRRFIGSR